MRRPLRTTAARCSSSIRRIASATTCWATSRSARAIASAPSNGIAAVRDPLRPNQNVCALPDEFQYFPDTTTNYEVGLAQPMARRPSDVERRVVLHRLAGSAARLRDRERRAADHEQRRRRRDDGHRDLARRQTSRIASTSASATRTSKPELTEVAPALIRDFSRPASDPADSGSEYIDGQPGDRLPGSPEDQATVYLATTGRCPRAGISR